MTLAWVIGANGLLGTALGKELARRGVALYSPADRLPWHDSAALPAAMSKALAGFAQAVAVAGANWELYWAAGIGAMGSSADELSIETSALAHLLAQLEQQGSLRMGGGAVGFASSAGAIYAGSTDDVITEASAIAPTTPYARAKLEQEALLGAFVERNNGVRALVARITTLYGPGQARGKRQGLLSHMARSVVRHKPIQIFVPFDTVRDYIAADDAAAAMIEGLRRHGDGGLRVKILGSEQPVTIAEIIATFRRLARRPPQIATSASRLSEAYARRILFRSIVEPDCRDLVLTRLPIGIAALLEAERRAFAAPQPRSG